MMFDDSSKIKYSTTHEWARVETNGEVTVGITDHAQHALGDIVYVDLPQVGVAIKQNQECGVVESVKSASDLYTPLSGKVIAINQQVIDTPALLNNDPLGAGWLFKIKLYDEKELDELMDTKAYAELLQK